MSRIRRAEPSRRRRQAPLSLNDRRNDLRDLPGVPRTQAVGLVDASTDATTQQAQVLIDELVDLALDSLHSPAPAKNAFPA